MTPAKALIAKLKSAREAEGYRIYKDGELICEAANSLPALCEMLETALNALEKLESVQRWAPRETDDDPLYCYPAKEALETINQLAAKTEGT
jgi:hypothetical protein